MVPALRAAETRSVSLLAAPSSTVGATELTPRRAVSQLVFWAEVSVELTLLGSTERGPTTTMRPATPSLLSTLIRGFSEAVSRSCRFEPWDSGLVRATARP